MARYLILAAVTLAVLLGAVGLVMPVRFEGVECGSAFLSDESAEDELRSRGASIRRETEDVAGEDDAFGLRSEGSALAEEATELADRIGEGCADARQDRRILLALGAIPVPALLIGAGITPSRRSP